MATTHGNDGKVYIGANQVAEINDWSLDQSIDTVDASAMGGTWKKNLTGLKDGSATINCWWDETDTNGQEAMTIGTSVTLNLYPEGNAAGDTYYIVTGVVQAVNASGAKDGVVSRNFTVVLDSSGTGISSTTV